MSILSPYYQRENKMVLVGNVYTYCPLLPFLPLFYGTQIILAKHISSTYQFCFHIIYGETK